ncbi:MAG: polyprenyl synthetase family protein [Methanomassiliicoccaceae archaeon]|jgi:geranylgeranyl diphosphate synthase type I|nr:polyprenyl synthetase family protein [Methanomassiliicoccaceae archaeon]
MDGSDMMDVKKILSEYSKRFDGPIDEFLPPEKPDNLMKATVQYPQAGGKRMRPAMVLAAAGAVGGNKDKAMPLAVAIEYIHNFTLIHDDYMDGDEKRRGMTTIHVKYGGPTAILAGDALFARAFEVIAQLDVPDGVVRDVLKVVTRAVWDLARGQQMDVNNENGEEVTMDEYIETIRLKTSVLFAAGAAGGAMIGGADKRTVDAVHEYAMLLGVAFQMFDDVLGLVGDPVKLGKSVGNDVRKGKSTVMVTHALKNIKNENIMREFRSVLGKMDATEEDIRKARKIMEDAGSVDFAIEMATDYTKRAIKKLDVLKDSDDKEFMIALAEFAMKRDV